MTLSLSPKWLKRCESTRTNFRKKWLHRSRFALQKVVTSETGTHIQTHAKFGYTLPLNPFVGPMSRVCVWLGPPSQHLVSRKKWLQPAIFGYIPQFLVTPIPSGYSQKWLLTHKKWLQPATTGYINLRKAPENNKVILLYTKGIASINMAF